LVSCNEKTVRRRLEDPEFRRQVTAARAALVERMAGRLLAAGDAALKRLEELLQAESESVCLGAARSILDLGTKAYEAGELEARLAELEAHLAEGRDESWP